MVRCLFVKFRFKVWQHFCAATIVAATAVLCGHATPSIANETTYNIDVKKSDGYTAIQRWMSNEKTLSPQHFLQIKNLDADLKVKDKRGRNLLMLATEFEQPNIVSEILKTRALNLNAQDKDGNTALHILVLSAQKKWGRGYSSRHRRYKKILKHLLAMGADPSIKNKEGHGVLELIDKTIADLQKDVARIDHDDLDDNASHSRTLKQARRYLQTQISQSQCTNLLKNAANT